MLWPAASVVGRLGAERVNALLELLSSVISRAEVPGFLMAMV